MEVKLALTLPRDARYVAILRNLVDRLLRDACAPIEAVDEVKLAVTEACGNAVLHARGAASYLVRLAVDEHGCEVEVVDDGPGFDPASEGAGDGEHGRGIFLMRTLVDDLHFERLQAGVKVRLRKRWGGARTDRVSGAQAFDGALQPVS